MFRLLHAVPSFLSPPHAVLIGEGNGNPLQYSWLENLGDGGAWWAAVYGVSQSRTRLKRLSSSSSSSMQSSNHRSLDSAPTPLKLPCQSYKGLWVISPCGAVLDITWPVCSCEHHMLLFCLPWTCLIPCFSWLFSPMSLTISSQSPSLTLNTLSCS